MLRFQMNLESLFNKAASHVQLQATSDGSKPLDQTQLLQLYGLYKSATIGPCNEPKPGIFNPKGRAKWDAWKQVSNLSKEEAQETYVERVKEFYDWDPADSSQLARQTSIIGGVAVSTFAQTPTDDEDEKNPPVFGWAKDNDLVKIIAWINEGNDVNMKDNDGLSVLHWVVDRGHVESCRSLLDYGANPLIVDDDGQTPLDYAITCEHTNIIDLLKDKIASLQHHNSAANS